jgi:hypothetical protein
LPIATLFPVYLKEPIPKAVSQHHKAVQQALKESIFFAVSFYFSIFA